ncbi:CDP-alcohol phosphatidyltransferase family protein, partial [Pseudomonadales bacterium]|nr:CDP-alcohol phosphatidyltransferase family protein [Pseudomonadales bacterium]
MDKLSLPNALSAARLLLAPLVAASLLEGYATVALALFLVAIATDLADGYLARTWNQTSAFGGLLDHTSDAVFIATTLAVLSVQQYVNWLLAPLVLISFAQYAIDSRVLEGHPLRGSQIGRYNGLAYFLLAGF